MKVKLKYQTDEYLNVTCSVFDEETGDYICLGLGRNEREAKERAIKAFKRKLEGYYKEEEIEININNQSIQGESNG